MGNVEKTDKNIVKFEFSVSPEEFEKRFKMLIRKMLRRLTCLDSEKEKHLGLSSKKPMEKKFFMKMLLTLFFQTHMIKRWKKTEFLR